MSGRATEDERSAGETPSEQASLADFLLGGGLLRRTEWDAAAERNEERIDHFVLGDQLGRGGMGIVYQALDERLQETVALKLLTGRGQLGKGQERLVVEAYAAARLQHPNIVRILHIGQTEGVPYLVMEYVPGQDLATCLQDGPLALREAVELARILADALANAHEHSVLHRDLKPANVLLTTASPTSQSGAEPAATCLVRGRHVRPVLTDFGLAKVLDRKGELTRTGQLLGTPEYMAPEQVEAAKGVDARADVYGLGATLFAMLAGAPPFQEASLMETVLALLREPALAPSRVRPEVDEALDRIVLRCLEKEPQARYPTARALAEDLDRYLHGQPLRVASTRRDPSPARAPTSDRNRRAKTARRADRPSDVGATHGAPWLIVVLAVLGVGGLLSVLSSGSDPSAAHPTRDPRATPTPTAQVAKVQPSSTPLDSTPPVMTVISPRPNAAVSSRSLTVRLEVQERSLERVTVEGILARATAGANGSAWEAEVPLREEGPRTLTLVAEDKAGNRAQQTLALIVDWTPPRWVVNGPPAVNPKRPDPLRIWGQVLDASHVRLTLAGVEIPVDEDGRFSHEHRPQSAAPSELRLVACDAAGNRSAHLHPLARDEAPPVIELDPVPPPVTAAASVVLRGRVSDAHLPKALELFAAQAVLAKAPLSAEGAFRVEVALKEGQNALRVLCRDGAGNPRALEVVITRDSQRPRITLSRPLPAEVTGKPSLRLNGTVSEACALTLNGKPLELRKGRFRVTLRLQPGENQVELVARDEAGNLGSLQRSVDYARRRGARVPKGTWWKPSKAQLAWARKTGQPLWFRNRLGMRFVLMPPGTFLMGSPPTEEERRKDEIQHGVTLSRVYYVSATEVTNAEYGKLVTGHQAGSAFGHAQGGPTQPVVGVSLAKARAFADELSRADPRTRYRLPTEAEWEYACRAGTKTAYFWGSSHAEGRRYCNGFDVKSHAEFGSGNPPVAKREYFPQDDGHRVTAPVGSFLPNPWGLYDMLGNAEEWVEDGYAAYPGGPVRDPAPAKGSAPLTRGGSYHMHRWMCRSAHRYKLRQSQTVSSGVRLVATRAK